MTILMPKSTAVWLIDNTSLTFGQIADFCQMHILEVNSIADGEVVENMPGADPVARGELTREEIDNGQRDPSYILRRSVPHHAEEMASPQQRRKSRYTPISRRSERPNAVLWFLRNHAELTDAQIVRLIGTTRNMIDKIRNRTHSNMDNIKPVDPVTLGLCSQIELDEAVEKGIARREKIELEKAKAMDSPGLRPASDAPDMPSEQADDEAPDVAAAPPEQADEAPDVSDNV